MAQAAGFGKIFEIADAFRADPSFTARHATEFTSIDAEISWIDIARGRHGDARGPARRGLHGRQASSTATRSSGCSASEVDGADACRSRASRSPRPSASSPSAGYVVPRADGDLDPEGERRISAYVKEEFGHDFVFLTDYATRIRPFYHMRHADDPSLTNSYDLIYRGTEISTGAQREHRIDVLVEQAEDKGLDPAELDVVPRVLPLRHPAARRLRHGPRPRADAHARARRASARRPTSSGARTACCRDPLTGVGEAQADSDMIAA